MRKFLSGYRAKGFWWFRVFGYGISWKSLKYHNMLFSEREDILGRRKGIKIRKWIFHFLRRKS